MNVNYNRLLYDKAYREYAAYEAELLKMTPVQMILKARETAVKLDILSVLREEDLFEQEAKALWEEAHPLEACYLQWLKQRSTYDEGIWDSIDERAREAEKNQV